MVKKYQLLSGKICEVQEGPASISVYSKPADSEKAFLTGELGIDEHTLQSALDPDEISRLEFEAEHVAIILKRPKNYSAEDRFLFKVASMGLFLFKEQLIIVAAEDVPLFDHKVFARVTALSEIVLKLLYRSIYHFNEHLRIINLITESLEQKINAAMENKYLLNLFILEKSLVYYLNAINANAMLITKMRNYSAKIGFNADCIEFLDDILIENNQCSRQAEIYSNILSSLMDARASIVGNNLNVLMKTLNIITIGIMVPTFVVSLFSMNVKIPLEEHPLAFFFIFALAMAAVAGFFLFWKYKKWI